jgi:hypothetical protein
MSSEGERRTGSDDAKPEARPEQTEEDPGVLDIIPLIQEKV